MKQLQEGDDTTLLVSQCVSKRKLNYIKYTLWFSPNLITLLLYNRCQIPGTFLRLLYNSDLGCSKWAPSCNNKS